MTAPRPLSWKLEESEYEIWWPDTCTLCWLAQGVIVEMGGEERKKREEWKGSFWWSRLSVLLICIFRVTLL